MCGIAGFYHFDVDRVADSIKVKSMADAIAHRGPDGEGFFVQNNIALGHRRLSIIDLASGGQPMFSDDKSIIIVFNGEIYNFLELKVELENLGHKFVTSSDTEVIIKAYQQWGIDCQVKFNGMWSFALYDKNISVLYLSRDRVGEKPLFYSVFDKTIVFGSEIKTLVKYGVPLNINKDIIELYLFLTYIPSPHTIYKNVFKLKPGHFIRVDLNGIKEQKYWNLPVIDEGAMNANKKEIYENFENTLTDSVKIRMRSDVKYGAFLSGGLDSSSVVSVMSSLSNYPIETFTIGFKEKSFDESNLAELVAKKFNTNHHLHYVEPDSFDDSLAKVIKHTDEPFGDSSAIPTGYVAREASKNVKMVLTGDGGDEILSGYNSYLGIKIADYYNRIPSTIKRSSNWLLKLAAENSTNQIRYKLNHVLNVTNSASMGFNERFIRKMAYSDYNTIKSLIKNKQVWSIEDFVSDYFNSIPVKDDFYKLMYFHFQYSLPDDYLTKIDRMTMSYSIEARVPFLDYRLIDYMFHVDKSIKLSGWKTKTVLRETIGKTLPDKLLKAPKKGFGVPLREWFKNDGRNKKIESLLDCEVLNNDVIRKIVEDNKSGLKDNGNFIWTLLMLNNWIK